MSVIDTPTDRLQQLWRTDFYEYLISTSAIMAVTCILYLTQSFIAEADIIMAYLATVVVLAYSFNRGPTLFAALFSVAVFDFFFVPPFYTFAVHHEKYFLSFAVMAIVGFMFSSFSEKQKKQLRLTSTREKNLSDLYQLARSLAAASSLQSIFNIANLHLGKLCSADVGFFKPDGSKVTSLYNESRIDIRKVPLARIEHCIGHRNESSDHSENQLPEYKYLPLGQPGNAIAAVVRLNSPLSEDQAHLMETFFSLVDLAVTRAQLSEQAGQAEIQAESERLRNAVLSAVSHDLRTPLGTIMGLASTLLDREMQLDGALKFELLETIYEESEQLSQKVTNLLQMSRSLRGKLTPNLELQNPEEFVGGTLSKMKHRLSRHRIHTGLDDTLLVPLDLSLMEVVLSNLLDNAVRFSPEQTVITIAGQRGQDCYELSVSDEGSGFKSKDTQQLFEQFYRADNQAIGGTGLGLAISKAIVEAHGGRVTATNHLPRGATFTVRLPLADIETEMPIHE